MSSATAKTREAHETASPDDPHITLHVTHPRHGRHAHAQELLVDQPQTINVDTMTPPPRPWLDGKRKFAFDSDILTCRNCKELLFPPVYQCRNGHTVCSLCSKNLDHGCPSCSQPIGRIRCVTAEKILKSLTTTCTNAAKGCTQMLRFSDLERHEQGECKYISMRCPMPECTYEGFKLTLPAHLHEEHRVHEVKTTEALCESLHDCFSRCRNSAGSTYVMVKDEYQDLSLLRVEELVAKLV